VAEIKLSANGCRAAVVSVEKNATQIGIEILKTGGNAIDAAVAMAFALAVTHPFAGNLGGGGFMLIRLATGEEIGIDFREMAPIQSTPTMFLQADGKVNTELACFGYLVAAIPGIVKGLETVWQKFGSLSWESLINPSIALAQQGIYLNKYDAMELRKNQQFLALFPETRKVFFRPDGQTYGTEDLFKQPDLARTLQAIARYGAKTFYEGSLANKIVADFAANGGIITKQDLKSYEVKFRTPIKTHFQGYEVLAMSPPSAGGITVLQLLNILKQFDLAKDPLQPENLHLLIESMRHVFLKRTKFLGDPDFIAVPIDELLAGNNAREIVKIINRQKATPSKALSGDVSVHKENIETTHFSVIDEAGNMVATTITLEDGFGSKAVVKDLGFLLNSEMHDFNINPFQKNIQGGVGSNPNGIAPQKRMLSSMAPTLVLKQGKPFLITGSPGGRTIANTVLQVILGTTIYGFSLKETLRLPRFSHLWMPDFVHIEKNSWPAEVIQALEAKGHIVNEGDYLGDAHSILINSETGEYEAEADPRRNGWAEAF